MFERDGYPAGVPCWVDTLQPDPEAAAAFYGQVLGWTFTDRRPAGSASRYLVARVRGADVAGVGEVPPGRQVDPVWRTSVWVEDADATAATVRSAGGSVVAAPFDVLDAGRAAVVADPSGAEFGVWQAGTHRGAQRVNEAGTWNWSGLDTWDPEGSLAFYEAVFGWEADRMGSGPADPCLWRRPGYGDFLARTTDPDVRRRQAAGGAPPGFEDAVAWMTPMTPERFHQDTPARWGVTFAVDDPDLVAGTASELGGAVVVAPFDVWQARIAVLRDPQGAAFTVSRYVPAGS